MTDLPDIEHLRGLTGIKWTRFGDDVIPAWVADMDFPTAPAVSDALREMVDAGDLGYNLVSFDDRVVNAWVEWSARRYGWRPDPEECRTFGDVLQPISAILSATTEPGDGVVIFTPVYSMFFAQIGKSGRRLIECPLEPPGWRHTADALRSVIDDTTRAIILCNPHNPTGRVLDAEELAGIAHIAGEHDLLVLSDEIWQDLVFPGATHVPFASLGPEVQARTVTLTSASKSFNLGGLNCAVAHIGPEYVREQLAALFPFVLGGVNALGARAALEAWTHGEPWLDETIALLTANRDHLAARLAAELPQVGFETPQATYLAWLDLREIDLGGEPAMRLIAKSRVGLSPGPEFGAPGEGYARLNFATTPDILDEIIDRIVGALR